MRLKRRVVLIAAVLTVTLCGCIKTPYKPQGELFPATPPVLEPSESQFSRGEPVAVVDFLGKYIFSLPAKIVLANWHMENHEISTETEQALRVYLQENGLTDVKVRLNEYAPGDEWTRLTRNTSVAAGWRYSVGVLTWLFYTILPQRIFGGDNYNPFTNTISIYTDIKAVALHEGGHAKDFGSTEYKGSVAILRLLPLYSLRDEAVASSDALSYANDKDDVGTVKRGYKTLYPAFGTYVGGELTLFVPGLRYATMLLAIPGHIVGRIKAAGVESGETTAVATPAPVAETPASPATAQQSNPK